MPTPETPSALPAEYTSIQRQIDTVNTAAPNMENVRKNVTALSIAHRNVLVQQINTSLAREDISSDARGRLVQLQEVVAPTFTDQVGALPNEASRGLQEAFRGPNQALSIGLLSIGGIALFLASIRNRSQQG